VRLHRYLAFTGLISISLIAAGCSGEPTSATVTVISHYLDQDGATKDLNVTVLDSAQKIIGFKVAPPGETITFENLPLGRVTIDVPDVCSVETTLEPRGATLIIEANDCAVN
jgi:hypothetical protein